MAAARWRQMPEEKWLMCLHCEARPYKRLLSQRHLSHSSRSLSLGDDILPGLCTCEFL
jgi:hypothetical protein